MDYQLAQKQKTGCCSQYSSKTDTALDLSGVPQGSILDLILFFVYVNNINELTLNGMLTLWQMTCCCIRGSPQLMTLLLFKMIFHP